MRIRTLHPWQVTLSEAIQIQRSLRGRLIFTPLPEKIHYVAGTDVSFSRYSSDAWAAVVVVGYPDLYTVEEKWVKGTVEFPYIPGALSFREIPLLLRALKKLSIAPDVMICDGQGIAHPRGLGLASHLGLLLGIPTIGCAKKRLIGQSGKVGKEGEEFSLLSHEGKVVGAVVKSKAGVSPLFVSPGYKCTLHDAIRMVLDCSHHYRIPEPTRRAHILTNRLRRLAEAS